MGINFEQKFKEAKTGGLVSIWAYGEKPPDKGWDVIDSISTSDGLTAFCFVNNQTKEIWFGYAGTDSGIDYLQYPSIVKLGFSTQVRGSIEFTGNVLYKIQNDQKYIGYTIHGGAESWGDVPLQACAKIFGFSAIGIDGPGAAAYMGSDYYKVDNSIGLGRLGARVPADMGNFSYTALMGTNIGTIGTLLPGTITGDITILNYDKGDYFGEHRAANERVANGSFTLGMGSGMVMVPVFKQREPHVVQASDTWEKISLESGFSVEVLYRYNNNRQLRIGDVIYYPNCVPIKKESSDEYMKMYNEHIYGPLSDVIDNSNNGLFAENVSESLYYDCFDYSISYDSQGGMIVTITDKYTGISIVASPGDGISYNSGTQSYTITHIENGAKEYYDPIQEEYVYRYADGSGYLRTNGKETYFGSDQIYLNADGSVIVPQHYIYVTNNNLFILTTDPNFTAQQGGSADPTTSANADNSTLLSEATHTIKGVGNVNTVRGNEGYANSILSDSYRPGANEVLATGTLANGDFSYANISNIANGTGAYTNMLSSGAAAWIPVDPLVLDLNGDGVKLTSFGSSPVLFDVDHDGKKELTGWTSAQDGIVVVDLNGNGKIDGIHETLSEYFNGAAGTNGDTGTKPYANGFAALKSLDSNNDGKFTAADTAWANVKVWTDADHDGETDSGELKTLVELGITSINLTSATQSGLVNGG
ncbi:LysM peptidoglycan-binding domain-containing protein, partial [Candidatus Roizmanbacteria bacterium]|nr:LysM peptidoglycan-binding domain-containing protein [Candidatus Roizmanbacteria bacterium]